MKVVSNEALTKLIQLIKSTFIKTVNTVEVEERELAAVATSGSYSDLANKPSIPAATSDLTNDSGFITSSDLVWGNITGTLSNQSDLQTALSAKANDSDVVHITGDEAIGGIKTFTNAIKAASSNDLGFVVTTVNRARAQNGYYQLGNGLIINWGWFDNLAAGTVVTFSKAFTSSTSYGLCVTPHNGNNTSGYSMHVNTTTATSFKIAKSTTGSVYGFYIAVGY